MEGKDGMSSSGVTVLGSDAPSNYHIAPRSENPTPVSGSTQPATTQVSIFQSPAAAAGAPGTTLKKKRGRPRKYTPDGSVPVALSPRPISSSAPPPVIDFSAVKQKSVRAVGYGSKVQHSRIELQSVGDWVSCSVGASFIPHIITVNAGEDVTMKIISFSQQGPRAICILSANGVISSVTLRQPDSSGGTLTYEGRFEILSLTGSFMPSEVGGLRNRSGGMSVSLASPDGRVVGGGVAGLLVAASPVQIVVGSFLTGNQHEQKTKKQKAEYPISTPTPTPMPALPISSVQIENSNGVQGQHPSAIPKHSLSSSTSFRGENWSSLPPDSRNKPTDINVALSG